MKIAYKLYFVIDCLQFSKLVVTIVSLVADSDTTVQSIMR